MPHALLTGLSELSAPDLRARLVEARKTATALIATDLIRARHDALVAGVAAVDAALRQASLDGVTALVGHIEAATPTADHPALKRRPAPMIDARAMITPPRPAMPPRVPVPAPAVPAPKPPGGLGALRRAVPAPQPAQPEEEMEPARPRQKDSDRRSDLRIPPWDPADDDIPW